MKNVKKGHTRPIVCLDAGHYGKYNRSPVVPAYYESDMNWKLHLMLKEELEVYGIEVTRTRTNKSKDLALVSRGKASEGADLFLSLHSNAADAASVDRVVGIYLVDDAATNIDEMSKELAVLLSEEVAKVMQTKDKPKQYSKLANSDRDGDGKKDDDYYGVLFGAHQVGTAGVILEHSFHTNERAAKWLLVESNLAKLAKAEAAVIARYFGMTKEEQPAQQPAAKPADTSAKVKLDPAKSFDKSLAGTYKVNARSGLNLRTGAAINKTQLEVMEYGSEFRCYGYYTDGWLYGVSASGKTGFCSKAYLVKK